MADGITIIVEGLDQAINDFQQLAGQEVYEHAHEGLNEALRVGFEGTQLAVPVDDGDYRRPAGALRDSGRMETEWDGDHWVGRVTYGTNTDELPYAAWTLYKNIRKPGGDYLEPMDDIEPLIERAMDTPFTEVFGED